MSANLSLCVNTGQAAFREGPGSDTGNQPYPGTALCTGMSRLGLGRRWVWELQVFNNT